MPHQLTPEQEQALVEQARLSADGVRDLYRHYLPPVYAYIVWRVGRVHDAEDLTSDTFLKAVQHLDTFEWRGPHSFKAWLLRIARNTVQDAQRRTTRQPSSVPLDDLPTLHAAALLPEDVVLQREQFARLHRLLGTLSPRRQEIITLRFFGGLRNQEIAAILELDERTVAAHLCRGLEDLHRKLIEEDAHEHVERPE